MHDARIEGEQKFVERLISQSSIRTSIRRIEFTIRTSSLEPRASK